MSEINHPQFAISTQTTQHLDLGQRKDKREEEERENCALSCLAEHTAAFEGA